MAIRMIILQIGFGNHGNGSKVSGGIFNGELCLFWMFLFAFQSWPEQWSNSAELR